MQTNWDTTDEAALQPLVTAVLAELTNRQPSDGAAVLALHGDLGAGKTTFTQTLAASLGVTEAVTSPTFVVIKSYELLEQSWEQLVHMDAYRLEQLDELGPLRFAEVVAEPDSLVVIEWAEKIADALPSHTLHLTFTIAGEARNVSVDG